jgi:hypothetical protein
MHDVSLLGFPVKNSCNLGDDLKSMPLIVIPAKRQREPESSPL